MKTKLIRIEGIVLIVPEIFQPDFATINSVPNCCGAGRGLGEIAIPETFYRLRISAACRIHDFCWEVADVTWEDFHQTNYMFLKNLLAIIRARSGNGMIRALRNYRATTYFTAVDEVGAKGFWKLKGVSPPQV